MDSRLEFEKKYEDISNSELWGLLKKKVAEEGIPTDFLVAVGKICEKGILLSKDTIRFFPNFTLHDITHMKNVCRWMVNLLGDRKNDLSATEAALLVMAACCHDIGMSVSVEQEEKLKKNPNSANWKKHFMAYPKDELEYMQESVITPRILRNYVRVNHHNRISEQITANDWLPELTSQNITRQNLIELCKSHGESLKTINPPEDVDYDLRFCAVLLRLADILDFDSTRAPDALFKHLGLNTPEDYEHSISQLEWLKNRSGGFGKINLNKGTIHFSGSFSCIALEVQVKEYEKWVTDELISCAASLSKYNGEWSDFRLPYKISENVDRQGYKFGDFRLTMDDDQVIKLLIGQNLYSDPGVFVRELLQNSIDAILTRRELDPHFRPDEGKIDIRTWRDNEGYDWFRIEDNGTGMDEKIILQYFLKIGNSYYTSDDFKVDRKRYKIGENNSFSPTSRFGIGILSCFLSDPNNNRIEVSTKRYSHSPDVSNSAIRLNIDGLHGYYYYADEKEQNELDDDFKPLHAPDSTIGTGYRSEVGTTICVRTNLYKMHNIKSFMEIVDKYVQFPDVQIEYSGQDGHKLYTCRREFEEKINNIGNYDQEKKCILVKHDLPDSVVDEINKNLPDIKWIKKPSINISYYPLNKLSVGDDLSGVVILFNTEADIDTVEPIIYEDVEYKPSIHLELGIINRHSSARLAYYLEYPHLSDILNNPDSLMIDIMEDYNLLGSNDEDTWQDICRRHSITKEQLNNAFVKATNIMQLKRLYNTRTHRYSLDISHSLLSQLLSPEEAVIWEYAKPGLNLASYNGILADTDKSASMSFFEQNESSTILLLNGEDYYPEVNMARDEISKLPLQASLDLAFIRKHFLKGDNYLTHLQKRYRYDTITEKEYFTFLKENPVWESTYKYDGKTVDELTEDDTIVLDNYHSDSYHSSLNILTLLSFAILKKHFKVYCYVDNNKCTINLLLKKKENEKQLLAFPVQMFFNFIESKEIFAIECLYNIEHPFSKWLIKNQSALLENAPGIYNNLIDIMIHRSDRDYNNDIISLLDTIKEYGIYEVEDELYNLPYSDIRMVDILLEKLMPKK